MSRGRFVLAVVVVAALLVGVSSLALAGLLGQRVSSTVHEAQNAQRTQLASAAREAATLVVAEVDGLRAEAQLVGHDARLDAVAVAGTDATPAQLAAARAPLQFLTGVHPVQVSLARIRTAAGVEVLRVVDAESARQGVSATTTMERGDGGLPWVEKALVSTTGQVFTSPPHGLALLKTDVVTTVVPLGPDRPVGTFEIETPVSWIVSRAATPVTLQGGFRLLRAEQAQTLLGDQPARTWAGLVDVGDQTYAWNRVTFDDRDQSLVDLDWYVVASEPAITFGWSDLPATALVLGALGVLALVTGGVAAWLAVRTTRRERREQMAANRRLQSRLAEMSVALGRVAAGDLGAALPVAGFEDDTLRDMAGSFDATIGRLRGLVGQAQQHGLSLAQAAVELRAAAAQQASAATEQNSVVTETTATIEELAATAAQIAQTSEQVATLAGRTLHLTEAGRASVNSAVEAMGAVAASVETIGERAVGLGETGREIARILAVIDDLSERTNLLALNAAIEAARAGEHGQGFAVVAGEVRRLAERARASTTQIQTLVSRIGEESGATVVASQEGRREVDRAQGVAQEAAAALETIAGMVDDTTLATREISIATQQQRSASDQVVVAMGQVSDASRQYAVGSRQAAASAQELALLAQTMQATIATFSTESAPPPGSRPGGVAPARRDLAEEPEGDRDEELAPVG